MADSRDRQADRAADWWLDVLLATMLAGAGAAWLISYLRDGQTPLDLAFSAGSASLGVFFAVHAYVATGTPTETAQPNLLTGTRLGADHDGGGRYWIRREHTEAIVAARAFAARADRT